MDRVAGKVAIVTGAATGLGEASAVLLAREGAKVVVTDLNDERGQTVVTGIVTAGGQALYVHQDVTRPEDWTQVLAGTVRAYGRLDILVNNAGVGSVGSVEDIDLVEWHRVQSVNSDAVFLGIKYAIGVMKKTGGGSIINISSIEGIIGEPLAPAYNASKGAVRILTKSAALWCASQNYNIRVNSIHPGFIDTEMVRAATSLLGEAVAAFQERILGEIPVRHLGEPQDIAYGVLYLASDESKYMTGSELVIDGGYTAH